MAAPSNLYGPHDGYSLGHGHLVAAAIAKVHVARLAGDPTVEIWGDGTARDEFTYVLDLAEWLVSQVGVLSTWPQMLNLGCGVDHSIAEYYEVAKVVVGYTGSFTYDTTKLSGGYVNPIHYRAADYSIDIRGYLDAHKGRPQRRYRETYDAMFDEAGTRQFNSLWAIPAQIAIREAQAKAALKKLPPQ